jgi:hypothetical protein
MIIIIICLFVTPFATMMLLGSLLYILHEAQLLMLFLALHIFILP